MICTKEIGNMSSVNEDIRCVREAILLLELVLLDIPSDFAALVNEVDSELIAATSGLHRCVEKLKTIKAWSNQ